MLTFPIDRTSLCTANNATLCQVFSIVSLSLFLSLVFPRPPFIPVFGPLNTTSPAITSGHCLGPGFIKTALGGVTRRPDFKSIYRVCVYIYRERRKRSRVTASDTRYISHAVYGGGVRNILEKKRRRRRKNCSTGPSTLELSRVEYLLSSFSPFLSFLLLLLLLLLFNFTRIKCTLKREVVSQEEKKQ